MKKTSRRDHVYSDSNQKHFESNLGWGGGEAGEQNLVGKIKIWVGNINKRC